MQKIKQIFLVGLVIFFVFGVSIFFRYLSDTGIYNLRASVLPGSDTSESPAPLEVDAKVEESVVPSPVVELPPPAVEKSIEAVDLPLPIDGLPVESQALEVKTELVQPASNPIVDQSTSKFVDQGNSHVQIPLEDMKKQLQLNKKVIDSIAALRNIPTLLSQPRVVDGTAEDASRGGREARRLLEAITAVVVEMTDNLQQNTLVLENSLDSLYKQQGTYVSHGRCIETSYFTYSDAENICLAIQRRVCSTSDIVPDNRYENLESCQRSRNLIQIDGSREMLAFQHQKEEYLRRLMSLQQVYKYYSVRWEELVDLVKDSQNFDSLGAAGNAINSYRIENQKSEEVQQNVSVEQTATNDKKILEESVPDTKSIPDSMESPLPPAASVQ
ncbi:MAG: hypothetical protein AAB551_01050 [Patescibacteria group bacterium]